MIDKTKPYACYTTRRMGWDIWLELGNLEPDCLTEKLGTSETEEEAWEKWQVLQDREKMNIRNYE